jgi:hypothetical protein
MRVVEQGVAMVGTQSEEGCMEAALSTWSSIVCAGFVTRFCAGGASGWRRLREMAFLERLKRKTMGRINVNTYLTFKK